MTPLGKNLFRGFLRGPLVYATSGRPVTSLTTVLPTVRTRGFLAPGQRFGQVGSLVARQTRRLSEMPRPIVYLAYPSPPSRSVLLAAAAMGLDIDVRQIDLIAMEHHSEEYKASEPAFMARHFTWNEGVKKLPDDPIPFEEGEFFLREVRLLVATMGQDCSFRWTSNCPLRRMNPEHTVPTLNDDGFVLWDSHAIMCYLVDKYAKNDSLYPKDLQRRALVDQRLHFDAGVLFPRLRFIVFPLILEKTTTVATEKLELLQEAYEHLNNFLEGKKWLVGDTYTLADISCVATVSSLQSLLPIDDFPNVKAWLQRCAETLPGYETHNIPGCKMLHKIITSKISPKGKL